MSSLEFASDAATPPQDVCPQTTMYFTFKWKTANWTIERREMSVGFIMFAMLRCVKTSPGLQFRIVVSGTRESAQPSQRIGGA